MPPETYKFGSRLIDAALMLLGAIAFFLFLIMLTGQGGCAPSHPTSAGPLTTPAAHVSTSTPASLTNVAVSLDWIIVLAIVVVGVGVGLFFFLPAAHNLSLAIAGVAGGVEASALIARVSLWFVPWVAAVLAAGSLAFFIYEVVRNRKLIDAKITGALAI